MWFCSELICDFKEYLLILCHHYISSSVFFEGEILMDLQLCLTILSLIIRMGFNACFFKHVIIEYLRVTPSVTILWDYTHSPSWSPLVLLTQWLLLRIWWGIKCHFPRQGLNENFAHTALLNSTIIIVNWYVALKDILWY